MMSSVIPSAEVFLLRIAAHVLEWQHGDRRLVGKRERRRVDGIPSSANAIDPHWLRDVLELLLAHVADVERELSLDLLIGVVGKADRAGLASVSKRAAILTPSP